MVATENSQNRSISVVMCTYNGEKYLREQLDSILRQTYPILELIVQDDCSTDHTCAVIEEYVAKYPFIKFYRNERQLGINQNFFSAMQRAQGDFIAISDQDDIWDDHKLEIQIDLIGGNLLCSGKSHLFSDDPLVVFPSDERIPNYNLCRFMFMSPLPGHSFLFRKDLLACIPDSSKAHKSFAYDEIIGMTAASQNSIVYAPKPLVNFRRHASAATYTPPNNYNKSIGNILTIFFRTYRLSKALKPIMQERLHDVLALLDTFPRNNQEIQKAKKLAATLISGSYLQKASVCVKLRNEIFYTRIKNPFVAFLRAIYFPIYSYEYFKRFSCKRA